MLDVVLRINCTNEGLRYHFYDQLCIGWDRGMLAFVGVVGFVTWRIAFGYHETPIRSNVFFHSNQDTPLSTSLFFYT